MMNITRSQPLASVLERVIDHRGRTPKKLGGDFVVPGVRVLSANDVKDGRLLLEETSKYVSREMYDRWMPEKLKPGDVLLTSEAPLGEVAYLKDGSEFCLGQRLFALRPDRKILDPRFLYYLLRSSRIQHRLHARATGTTAQGIRQSELLKVELEIPALGEQKAIAHVLGTLDDKIELNRRMNQTLEEIARALFRSWFVDFDPVWAKGDGRQPEGLDAETAALFPVSFEDSLLGPIPLNWQVVPLTQTCERIFSGGTPSTKVAAYWGGGIPWLSSGETRNWVIGETEKTITSEGVVNSSTRLARAGCTVIAGAGQGYTRGQTSLLTIDSYINQSVVALASDCEVSSDLFLFLDLERRYEQFRQISDSHSSRGSLTTKLLGGIQVILPPRHVICRFDEVVEPIVNQITINLRQTQDLEALRDALLPKLLSGELRIPDVEQCVAEAVV